MQRVLPWQHPLQAALWPKGATGDVPDYRRGAALKLSSHHAPKNRPMPAACWSWPASRNSGHGNAAKPRRPGRLLRNGRAFRADDLQLIVATSALGGKWTLRAPFREKRPSLLAPNSASPRHRVLFKRRPVILLKENVCSGSTARARARGGSSLCAVWDRLLYADPEGDACEHRELGRRARKALRAAPER